MVYLRSKLAQAKGSTAGGKGSKHWLLQRFSAILMLPLFVFLLFNLKQIAGLDFDGAKIWFQNPVNALVMALLIFNICFHGSLGLQVVIEDYVSCKASKFTMLIMVKLGFFVLGFAGIFAIFSLYN